MTRPFASTTADLKAPGELERGLPFENIPDGFVDVTDFTTGIKTAVPRNTRDVGSALSILNGRTRFDWIGRRPAHTEYITAPDSNRPLHLAGFKTIDGVWVVRVANGSTHFANSISGGWQAVTLDTDAQHYASFEKLTSAQVLGFIFLASPSRQIQNLDLNSGQLKVVSEAPIAKFVTSFAERLVAAYTTKPIGGVNPVNVSWSENADPFDWDGQGAGEENLIQSPSDTGDDITGVFGMENVMVILRERSIWHAIRTGFAQAPFSFQPVITNVGCDMPYTAVRVPGGVIYADSESKAVWFYQVGSRPVSISWNVDDIIFASLVNPNGAEAEFDPLNQEYQLGIPTDSGNPWDISERWVYSLKKHSWTLDDSPTITTIGRAFDVGSPQTIDDLTGQTIDDLAGQSINDLSSVFDRPFMILKGGLTGEVMRETFSIRDDLGVTAYDFIWASQNMNPISRRRTLQRARVSTEAGGAGDTHFEFSEDASTWTTVKTSSDPSLLKHFGFRRQFTKEDEMYIRVRSAARSFRMREGWIKILEKGMGRIV